MKSIGLYWIVIAGIGLGVSGVPPLFLDRRSDHGQRISFYLNLVASILGFIGLWTAFQEKTPEILQGAWGFPGGSLTLGLDPLTSFFLIPVFLISVLGSLYGLGYWRQSQNPGNGHLLRFFYGLLASGMVFLLVARNSILFLFGWEMMALAAFFLVAVEDSNPGPRQAAWIYWVATHLGVLALLAFFILMKNELGSYDWSDLTHGFSTTSSLSLLFILAVVGFGLKAGIMPFHFWLPKAHASAPSHVSGMLSGVMLNMGLYGMIRICGLVPPPPYWWGGLLMVLGLLSGLGGVIAAVHENDLKKALAYSSIENMGIAFLGLGLALWGRSAHNPLWMGLGLAGSLFHAMNHSLFKPLLFLCSGSVIHAAQTRKIDRLGGMMKVLPLAGSVFVAAACAGCALPPLNGFLGEWVLYQGLFSMTLQGSSLEMILAASAIGVLALVGALGLVCFVRIFSGVFLGNSRFPMPSVKHQEEGSMGASLIFLLVLCLGVGIIPRSMASLLDWVVGGWGMDGHLFSARLVDLLPLEPLGLFNLLLILFIGFGVWWVKTRTGSSWSDQGGTVPTWDCGFVNASSPRIQYTASSFSQILSRLYRWALSFRVYSPVFRGLLPAVSKFKVVHTERLLGGFIVPLARGGGDCFLKLRLLQQGNISLYLLYIFFALLLALLWGTWSMS